LLVFNQLGNEQREALLKKVLRSQVNLEVNTSLRAIGICSGYFNEK